MGKRAIQGVPTTTTTANANAVSAKEEGPVIEGEGDASAEADGVAKLYYRELEVIIDYLIVSLGDDDTAVRWSAAKGRMC